MLDCTTIFESLMADRSKQNIAHWVNKMIREGFDPVAFMVQFHAHEPSKSWKLTWLLSHYIEASKDDSFQLDIWQVLKTTEHQGIQRDLWRAFSFISINESIAGEVYDKALGLIHSQLYAIAVRAHAMQCAFNIAQTYPELKEELALVLKGISSEDSAGIRSRTKRLLKDL